MMNETRRFGANYLPVLFVSFLFIATITSFVIAVAQSDVTPWFPAISDTATKSPESNIFSQLVNISTFIGLFLIYVRYLQVKRDVEWLEGNQTTLVLNRYSLPVGFIAVLGCSIAANFPETQVPIVHIIGAITLFAFGNVYLWAQVIVSFRMRKLGLISLRVFVTRLVMVLLTSTAFIISTVTVSYASTRWDGDYLHWKAKNPGFTGHIIGNVSEWLMVFSFLIVTLTFTNELAKGRLQASFVMDDANFYTPVSVKSKSIED